MTPSCPACQCDLRNGYWRPRRTFCDEGSGAGLLMICTFVSQPVIHTCGFPLTDRRLSSATTSASPSPLISAIENRRRTPSNWTSRICPGSTYFRSTEITAFNRGGFSDSKARTQGFAGSKSQPFELFLFSGLRRHVPNLLQPDIRRIFCVF